MTDADFDANPYYRRLSKQRQHAVRQNVTFGENAHATWGCPLPAKDMTTWHARRQLVLVADKQYRHGWNRLVTLFMESGSLGPNPFPEGTLKYLGFASAASVMRDLLEEN